MSPSKSKPSPTANRKFVAASLGVLTVLLGGLAYWAWPKAPQLKANSDVYASLDALFTAVTARREPLVADCESKLAALHSQGKIPEPAWKKISQVIELAKNGQWESAAQDLYLFIERQNGTT